MKSETQMTEIGKEMNDFPMCPTRMARKVLRSHASKNQGVALVIVLSVLVLLTILVVGFLNRATVDRTSAAAYFDRNHNSMLADQAVNIVQAQIDHASSQPNTAWASQPGMIRTFNQEGDLERAYKLYSDTAMVASQVNATEIVNSLQNWASSPAHFVDLNEPVMVKTEAFPNGKAEYPIVDPAALESVNGSRRIQGFDVTEDAPTTAKQPIPMPVRWLYVLEDGQVVAPQQQSGTTATIPNASESNPIIGRMAFWTDDETTKLNINTASHGRFWDIPRAFTRDERDRMARFQPANNEFQRYPGHPAMTSLRPVLGYKYQDEAEFEDFVYELIPRIAQGGSMGGTVFRGAQPVDLDTDRLYYSIDELLFSANDGIRDARDDLARDDIEITKFFLTARSNSPEVNLFNLPRMSIWPINFKPELPGSVGKLPGPVDKVIARSSTINGKPYYFQRRSSVNSALDFPGINNRNAQLYTYITTLLGRAFPGFGSTTFVTKYTKDEVDQIVASIFDYIRSTNLYYKPANVPLSQREEAEQYRFTGEGYDDPLAVDSRGSRLGQVTPLLIGNTNKGFGRLPVLSQAIFHLYVGGMRGNVEGEDREYPSAAYPFTTGRLPLYSNSMEDQPYKPIRDFLNDVGVGQSVRLLTRGIIYFETFDPMLGYALPKYKFDIRVRFQGPWTVNGKSLNFRDSTIQIKRDHTQLYDARSNGWTATYTGPYIGGVQGPLWLMQNHTYVRGRYPAITANYPGGTIEYPLGSEPIEIHLPIVLIDENEGKTDDNGDPLSPKPTLPPASIINDEVVFSGGEVIAEIVVENQVVQTYNFDFPGFTKPAPRYPARGYLDLREDVPSTVEDNVLKQFVTSADFRNRWVSQPFNSKKANVGGALFNPGTTTPHASNSCDVYLIQEHDVIVGLEPNFGDKRLLGTRQTLTSGDFGDPAANFVPHKKYFDSNERIAVDFRNDSQGQDRLRRAIANGEAPGRILDIAYGQNAMPVVPNHYPNGVQSTTKGGFVPDFDNGTLHFPDDAYINMADQGSVATSMDDAAIGTSAGGRGFPWYGSGAGSSETTIFFSPNKIIPSAGMFGSLPTGGVRNHPWQTLLFRPDPGNHPGADSPPDYLLLDLFWMPVAEPYAISEPFSANGKVNMNYQIMPFNYIKRSTGIRGVLEKQEMVVITNSMAYTGAVNPTTRYGASDTNAYKFFAYNDLATSISPMVIHRPLNIEETLKTFENLFNENKIFRSETEICSVSLIPEGETWSANFETSFWADKRLTGDNSREIPYTHLLPRLTTKSNTYTVHYRVQTLKKVVRKDDDGNDNWNIWDEEKDKVSAELRGSRTIERYIDPNNSAIPDYASAPNATPTLDAFYRWRTLHNKIFAP